MLTITGLDNATLIPEGATIKRVFWHVPGPYGTGPTFPSMEESLAHGITEAVERKQKSDIAPETITVDLRWELAYPDGGSMETVITRHIHDTIASATEHLNRCVRYSLVRAA